MGIKITQEMLVKPEEQKHGIHLGSLEKTITDWMSALGWDDLPNADVDGDLWLVGLDKNREAVDLVFYDPKDPARVVESVTGTGAYTYMGDARSGKATGDDEWGVMHLPAMQAAGITSTLVIGNLYGPRGLTWADVPNAYMRVFPKGVSDREGKLLLADKSDTIKAVKLTEIGRGTRCVVFGTLDLVGPAATDVVFNPKPSAMTSLREGLAQFDIEIPPGMND